MGATLPCSECLFYCKSETILYSSHPQEKAHEHSILAGHWWVDRRLASALGPLLTAGVTPHFRLFVVLQTPPSLLGQEGVCGVLASPVQLSQLTPPTISNMIWFAGWMQLSPRLLCFGAHLCQFCAVLLFWAAV